MPSQQAITLWVQQLRSGNERAVQQLWENYFSRLAYFARKKLQGRARLVEDEEDVALSAFRSFCRGMEDGRFANIADRDDLWNLLITVTLHKVLHLVRSEGRIKRGGNWKRVEGTSDDDSSEILNTLASAGPSPQVAAEVAEECDRLLDMLPNAEFKELAVLKMEGHTNQQIAAIWNKAERTVERKLNLIRQIWEKEAGDHQAKQA